MANNELICPVSGELCEYRAYCESLKGRLENLEYPVETLVRRRSELSGKPEELYAADLKRLFCSEQRINAIGAAAVEILQQPDLSEEYKDKIRNWESDMVLSIREYR